MRLLLLTKDLSDNSTGRTYVLWLLARHLDWEAKVIAPVPGSVWGPVAEKEFLADCSVVSPNDPTLDMLARESDLIVAVKPLPNTFGLALELKRRTGVPILVDVDDPDIDAILSKGKPLRALGKMLRRGSYWPTRRLAALLPREAVMVSNPVLQEAYGGVIVPHARLDTGAGAEHVSSEPTLSFVGTNRPHKGVEVLRKAARAVDGGALQLTVTDAAPADASPNERWIGQTTLLEGIELVKSTDIAVIPSVPTSPYSRGQLPVKIIDAMLAGRAVVASDFGPLAWALSGTGVTVRPDDPADLSRALSDLRDPRRRRALGERARERAIQTFTVQAVAPSFEAACRTAAGE
ncbi:glycosyltransferase family 4 protein [Microbacterium sp. NPDC055683]